jgi:hypothetical protein
MEARACRHHLGGMSSWKPLAPRSAAFVLTAVLALFMFFLALRAFLQPEDAAAGFGLPLAASADAAWLHVKGGRDLAVGVLLTWLLALRERGALFVVIASALVIPVNDGLQVVARDGTRIAYALGVHGSAAAFAVVVLFLLRRGR